MYRTDVCDFCHGDKLDPATRTAPCPKCRGHGYLDVDLGPYKSRDGEDEDDKRKKKPTSWAAIVVMSIAVVGCFGWLAWNSHVDDTDSRVRAYKAERAKWELEAFALGRPAYTVLVTGMSEKRYHLRARDAATLCDIPLPRNKIMSPSGERSKAQCFWAKLCGDDIEESRKRWADFTKSCHEVDKQMTREEYFACKQEKLDCNSAMWKLLDLVQ